MSQLKSPLVLDDNEQVHLVTEEKLQVRTTVLEMVLSSLCPYHKMLLYHILKCVLEDFAVSVTPYKDTHRHFSQSHSLPCDLGKKPLQDVFGFTDYQTSDGCCGHSCRLNAYSVSPVCICLKNLHCLSCHSVAISCINNVIGVNSCGCYAHPQRCPCSYQSFTDGGYIAPVGNVASHPFNPQKVCDSYSLYIRGCSPSPPPLSPIPMDANAKIHDKNLICSFVEGRCLNNQPPSLFPHEEEDIAVLHKEKCNKEEGSGTAEAERQTPNEDCTDCCTETGRHFDHSHTGTLFEDLMERISEKLKTIEPLEKEQILSLSGSQNVTSGSDVHLGKILTVLRKENDRDYNLKELLHQQDFVGNKSIQTPFCRRQKTAIIKSLDLPSSHHQSLLIKREFASLDFAPCRGKLTLESGQKPTSGEPNLTLTCTEVLSSSLENGKDEMTEESCGHQMSPLTIKPFQHILESEQDEENEGLAIASAEKPIGPFKTSFDSSRSRRNIVPPQRFSAYVTEPRKMYFAACFSESIFHKKAAKDAKVVGENSSSTSDINESSTELNLEGSCKNKMQTTKQEDDSCSNESSPCNVAKSSRTRSRKLNLCISEDEKPDCGTRLSFQRRHHEAVSRSCVTLRSSVAKTQNRMDSRVVNVNFERSSAEDTNTVEDALISNECQPLPLYTSPIRLMFVSPVVSGEEVKYSLKSAISGSASHQTFDPCEESSWGGTAKTEVEEDETSQSDTAKLCVTRGAENSPHKKGSASDLRSSNLLSGEHESERDVHGLTLSPPKRKPGRPKKLGPQVEKPAKRPIGRPPKHKTGNSGCFSKKGNAVNDFASCCEEDEKNKNLKITVVYGRSRRIRRFVSEGNGHFSKEQHVKGLQAECADGLGASGRLNANMERSNTGFSGKLPEEQTEKFNFVIPVKDKSHPSRNIKCAQQKCSATLRKPGRPPKVKISGISVTVTTVSPKQRRIHMNKDMTELHNETSQEAEPLNSNAETCKEPTTIELQSDAVKGEKRENAQDGTLSQMVSVPLRHSMRVRKPSIHLLHSVATSRVSPRTNALLQRPGKLPVRHDESVQIKSQHKASGETSDATAANVSSKNPCGQDLNVLSGISVDSIFTSNDPFRWWPSAASPDALNQEFNRRVQLMSDTWITEPEESSKSFCTEIEVNLNSRLYSKDNEPPKNTWSPVRMLFQKHCNMEKLCAWFMQTTETQSLAIVKKASIRNPYEIIQYNPVRPISRPNFCPSPQAERLKKHVKKFAKIVPKSPAMHMEALQRMSHLSKLKVRRKLFLLRPNPVARCLGQQSLLGRRRLIGKYGFTLLRVKTKFMTRKKARGNSAVVQKVATGGLRPNLPFDQTSPLDTDPRSLSPLMSDRGKLRLRVEKNTPLSDVYQEERISPKRLSLETLKECKVFLKKINSPESRSTAEECNFCTVELCDVSSPGCSLPPSKECKENLVKKEATDTRRTTRTKRSSRSPEEQQLRAQKRQAERKSPGASGSQPVKMAGQSVSRSQTAKRWCDFTADSSK